MGNNLVSKAVDITWTRTHFDYKSGPNEIALAADLSKPATDSAAITIVLVERRTMVRECLAHSLRAHANCNVRSYPNIETWLSDCSREQGTSLVVLSTTGKTGAQELQRQVSVLSDKAPGAPTILLCDAEDPDYIVSMLEKGARGYIPTSVPLDVAIEAMRLVLAGGVFVPASSLIAARLAPTKASNGAPQANGMFTARQVAVIEAVRRGKANKIIAHELNMRESTVKVHVRNIMKKLKARNRTEVAYMTSALLEQQPER
jgi:DNA-binding NarL/FixJ family response regulator